MGNLKNFVYLYSMCKCFFLCMCVCTTCVPGTCRCQKAPDLLELQFWMIVSHHLNAGPEGSESRSSGRAVSIPNPSFWPLLYFIILGVWVFCLHICLWTTSACHLRSPERGFVGSSHYSHLWSDMWMLRIKPRSPGKAGSALNSWAKSPALLPLLKRPQSLLFGGSIQRQT